MKKITTKLQFFFVAVLVLVLQVAVSAQSYKISGTVTDASTGEKLIGANVFIETLSTGAASNGQGFYEITSIPSGTYSLTVSFIGYKRVTENVNVNGDMTVSFALEPSSILLGETVVKSTRAVLRETPVAFTEISGADLEARLSSRDIPLELETVVPSVYSSPGGGGSGDATLYVRGFSQRNVAIMINGVPVNDMENKWVYWSNWAGLGDVTQSIQSQRGLGASPYSVNAIGGIINVQTSSVGSAEKYFKVKGEYGTDKLMKGSIAFHQKLSDTFSMTGLISRKTFDGYADGTYHREWTYYFSIGGVFGNHSLELTGVGSPQEHGQRPYFAKKTIADWAKYGKNFNSSQGRFGGGLFSETVNKYHKPAFNLNWNWQINDKSILSTVAYYSTGTGWGSGSYGSFPKRTADGYDDWDLVYAGNSARINNTYSSTLHESKTALRNSVNNHYWTGLLSTFTTKLSQSLTLNTGIDGRYYIGEHYRELTDLFGGDYYAEKHDVNRPGGFMAKVGDKINYYDDVHVRQLGGFGQIENRSGAVTTYLNVSAFMYGTKRIDYFLYTPGNQETAWQNFTGWTAKAGINYNLTMESNIYFNAGYFSTPPIVDQIFSNNTNAINQGIKNEKVLGIEAGYGYNTDNFSLKLNGFYTKWSDRAFASSVTINSVDYYVNVFGAEQLHIGGELEMSYKLTKNLTFNGMASLLSAKFQNDVTSTIAAEEDPTITKTVSSYVDGTYVSDGRGNFPMQRFTASFDYRANLSSGLSLNITPVAKFYGGNYAYFNPDSRSKPTDNVQPWKYPDYTIFDLHIALNYALANQFIKNINFGVHVFNLADNTDYIVEAQDGKNHDDLTSTVFYGRGRWINFNLAFNF